MGIPQVINVKVTYFTELEKITNSFHKFFCSVAHNT